MTPLACVGVILFAVLASAVIGSAWFVQWLYGGGNGRPRL